MFAKTKRKLKQVFRSGREGHESDMILVAVIAILVVIGLAMLSSASSVLAYKKFGDSYHYFSHQLVAVVVGAVLFLVFSRINYSFWRKYAIFFLGGSCLLLLLVFVPGLGATYDKASSWINIMGLSIQPSELVKVSFLIYLAAWLERRKGHLDSVSSGIGPFLLVLGVIAFLMVLQPDIGTLSIILFSSVVVYFIGGGKISHLVVVGLLGCVLLMGAYHSMSYVQERFQCVANPQMDTKDKCYQVNQSLIAVGSGGLWGQGVGQSRQKFLYLPEVTGDSIFSIIAEELGFVCCFILILLYFFLFYRGARIAQRAPDRFGQLLAVGIVSWIMIQAFLNIGGMINIIPMTGVPLPLISYGGSAMVSALLALGILVNISRYTKE